MSSPGYIFIIDGSHRLSSLSAWVNDDYGDGAISRQFYDGIIPDEQIKIAESTRKKVEQEIGSYRDFKLAMTHPDKVKPEIVTICKKLGALAIQLQWVEGDSEKAETSFLNINQQASAINPTEFQLIVTRNCPNSIAARAIKGRGKGHKYWSKFDKEIQEQIQILAKETFDLLFSPPLCTPIKTLDVPIGGKAFSANALQLIKNYVNISNDLDINAEIDEDLDGKETIKYLRKAKKVAEIILSNEPCSIGLHPIIYTYSRNGIHKTAMFYAISKFVVELKKRKMFNIFIEVRSSLELIIWNYDYLIQQINRKYREAENSYKHITQFLLDCITELQAGKDEIETIEQLASTKYDYLRLEKLKTKGSVKKEFDTDVKSHVYIKSSINSANKCKICDGLIHRNSISIDHIKRKQDGGLGEVSNGQLTHPYCNTGYKN